jgi:hypothetical protein
MIEKEKTKVLEPCNWIVAYCLTTNTKNLMSIIFKSFLSLIVAVLLAALAAWVITGQGLIKSSVQNDCWYYDFAIGSKSADAHTRAYVARAGVLALPATEVIYPIATTDSDGQPLDPQASYIIEGRDFDTRWWSITAYLDNYYIANDLDIYSYSQTTISRKADGSWVIMASPNPQKTNWLPTGDKKGKLEFVLRLYNPSKKIIDDFAKIELPKITKVKP